MAYRLLDPLARTQHFRILEGRERLHLLEREGLVSRARAAHAQGKEAYGQAKAKGTELHGKAKGAYDQGKQDLAKAKGTFSKVKGLSKPSPGGGGKKKGRLDIVPDALSYKSSDSWMKTGMKAGFRAPFDGFVATKDLLVGGEAESGLGKVLGWDKKSSFLDRAQDVVDVIGIIDPTGIADAANAIGYAARGKWGDAATSALGIIPYVGDLGKLGKYAGRAEKVASIAGKAAKAEGRLAKAAKVVEKGVAKKAAVHGAEKMAARTAAHAGEKAAAKAAMHGTEKAAAKGGGKLARMKQAYGKGKEAYGKGKEILGRVDDAASKIQARRDARDAGAPGQEQQPPERTPLATPTPQPTAAPQAAPDTTADLGRRGTGPASAPAPAPSMAPPDPGPLAKAREAEQRGTPTEEPKGGGGVSKGDRGANEVPVDDDCPEGKPTSSTFRATPGMKRCNKGTPGTHGD